MLLIGHGRVTGDVNSRCVRGGSIDGDAAHRRMGTGERKGQLFHPKLVNRLPWFALQFTGTNDLRSRYVHRETFDAVTVRFRIDTHKERPPRRCLNRRLRCRPIFEHHGDVVVAFVYWY